MKLSDRDTLAATGQLWETCDEIAKVASSGLITLATEKLDAYHSLFKDAIAELEEWDPNEEDTDTDSNPDSEHPNNPSPSTTQPSQIPHLLTLTLRLLRHIRLLYPALRKRRIRPFSPLPFSLPLDSSTSPVSPPPPPSPPQIESLDKLLTSIGAFSSEADEIAAALYARDENEVLRRLLSLRGQAYTCVKDTMNNWNGAKDEFSTWAQKWLELIGAINFPEETEAEGNMEPEPALTHTSGPRASHHTPATSTTSTTTTITAELPIR